MRVAILIGVSEYDNFASLPGCVNDVKAIKDMLDASKEFDEIRVYQQRVESSTLKSEITDFFNSLKSLKITEVFFYFSGHGSYFQDEFYYIMSDYEESKRRQTSLQNSDIDNIIKSVKPELVSKVIDACQSGVTYIKADNNIIEKYYNSTAQHFKKCYFLHSSMSNQYSYQDSNISYFTNSFVSSIGKSKKSEIRYKDIIDYISDDFESIDEQTPFFIAQADFTEIFIKSSDSVKQALKVYIGEETPEPKKEPDLPKYKSLVEYIKKDAKDYSSEEEAEGVLVKIKDSLSAKRLEGELKELFELKVTFDFHISDLPKSKTIGNWVKENGQVYFAEPTFDDVPYEDERTSGLFSPSFFKTGTVTKYKKELVGFTHTAELPYKTISIDLIPLYQNLSAYNCTIIFLISKKEIQFFYFRTDYKDTSWKSRTLNHDIKWLSSNFTIKHYEKINDFINKIYDENNSLVLGHLNTIYDSKINSNKPALKEQKN